MWHAPPSPSSSSNRDFFCLEAMLNINWMLIDSEMVVCKSSEIATIRSHNHSRCACALNWYG
jgi:hypothetical protein